MALVYSTDRGRLCPQCEHLLSECRCKQFNKTSAASTDGYVRLQRQSQGRGGKIVTVISGIDLPAAEFAQFAKKLKQHCGSGGTVKNGSIEIQGDHRTLLQTLLEQQGFKVKLVGG